MAMKVLLISGGSSGIGRATAQLFARHGYKVYEMSRRDAMPSDLETDCPVVHWQGDVTSALDCRRVVEAVLSQEGHIDVLICNAGMGIAGAAEFATSEDMHRQMEVNFFGTVHLVQAVLPSMRSRRDGTIILVGSMAGVFAIPYQSFYSASKAAIGSFASSLRNEVKGFGVRVSCLLPGDVKTGFTAVRKKNLQGEDLYTHMSDSLRKMERDEENGIPAEKMAHKLLSIAQSRRPALFHTVGWKYRLFLVAQKLVPATFINYVLGKMY